MHHSKICLLAILAVIAQCSAQADLDCVCPRHYRPVCGSDNAVYSNKCIFECEQRKNIGLLLQYEGECKKVVEEPKDDQVCMCTMEYRPVCGSDKKTYANPCVFACGQKINSDLVIQHEGSCEEEIPPVHIAIDPPVEKNPRVCMCTREMKPVCGSDGVTYSNACELKCAKETQPGLTLRQEGPCKSQ